MDLIDWIAASKRERFISERDEEAVRLRLRHYHARGFITDFIDAPIVAKEKGGKIVISRASSLWGRRGPRCIAYITPTSSGTQLDARIWHESRFTVWLCFSYGLATLLLLASFGAMLQSSSTSEGIAAFTTGILMAAFWILVTGAINAWMRAQNNSAIDELITVLLSVAKKEPNQSLEPTAPSGRGSS
jgi:hypothetical protein